MVEIDREEFQKYLNEYKVFGSKEHQRSNGDSIEERIKNFLSYKGYSITNPKTVRSIDDFSIDGIYYDVKTRDLNKGFSMPNLISYNRLKKIIDDNTRLIYIFVDYKIAKEKFIIEEIIIDDYFNINPEILRWGNLGTGQLQISSDKTFPVIKVIGREEFIQHIYNSYINFSFDLVSKVMNRIEKIPTLTEEKKEAIKRLMNG